MKNYTCGCLVLVILLFCGSCSQQDDVAAVQDLLPGISGPFAPTIIPKLPSRSELSAYSLGGENAMAVLVTDVNSSWLGLAHGLKSVGVPFRMVSDAEEALKHRVVMIYPSLTGANTSPQVLQGLAKHVRNGGTVMAFSVIGGGMPEVFGFEQTIEQASLNEIQFTSVPFVSFLYENSASKIISLAPESSIGSGLPGVEYIGSKMPPLAIYGTGEAAITQNVHQTETGLGYAFAFGIDLGHLILRGHNGRFTATSENYVNQFRPKIDSFLRLIKAIYVQGDPNAVTFWPVRQNREFTALITHDVDFTRSMNNVATYLEYESSVTVPATYFIQTKYITDYNDSQFFNSTRVSQLQQLAASGMEIGSHSVAHSNEFRNLVVGSGNEQFPNYQPFVQTFSQVRNASILGELRVSKFLLETLTGTPVLSFRPGHLSLPEQLPQLLEATNYAFSSSITANEALTHFPYRAMFNRAYDSETNVYELPVTIEDEAGDFVSRFDSAVQVAEQIASYGGLVNVLIHTDLAAEKLEFERKFVKQFYERAWFDTVGGFGNWWSVRDTAYLSNFRQEAGEIYFELNVSQLIEGLTLELPNKWKFSGNDGVGYQEGKRFILGPVESVVALSFTTR